MVLILQFFVIPTTKHFLNLQRALFHKRFIRISLPSPLSSMETAIATVIPTIGLLPAPIRPIIQRAGTKRNWQTVSMHTSHGIGHAIEAGPAAMLSGCRVRPVPAAGCNGEVLLALLNTFLLVGTGY